MGKPETFNNKLVEMPRPQSWETPMPANSDAYTFGSNGFESDKAKQKSTYYITFRRFLKTVHPFLFDDGDDRYVFAGINKIVWDLFSKRVTMEDLDETDRFSKQIKVTKNGLTTYEYPRQLWELVVTKYNGRPPIKIKALPEGSVCYPNEPVVEITSSALTEEQMGIFGAWFEEDLLKVGIISEFVTKNEAYLRKIKRLFRKYDSSLTEDELDLQARISLIDFGARSGICPQETEWLGEYYIWTFPGTDTLPGAYQAFKNNNDVNEGLFYTINALAHRNVETFEFEGDTYKTLYQYMNNGELGSFVADCYSYYDAVTNHILPLALHAAKEDNGKLLIPRMDSKNMIEQAIWTCRLAHKNDLFTTKVIDDREWRFPTTMKPMASSDLSWELMIEIYEALAAENFMPYAWCGMGMGGMKRNEISRDNVSAKYALCAYGEDNTPACKFSDDLGKTTLPGPFKLLRDHRSITDKLTIVFAHESGIDAREIIYDGSNIYKPFGDLLNETVNDKKARIAEDLLYMPLSLVTSENLNFPISDAIRDKRRKLLKFYAPKKIQNNY